MRKSLVDKLAVRLWDYLRLDHSLEASDCILVMGSNDIRCAQEGARLFVEDYAPLLILSGGFGRLSGRLWREPEAHKFRAVVVHMGVPPEKVLVEDNSSNTGENILFTRRLATERGIVLKSAVVVHKPYLQRRACATFKRLWPELRIAMTSPHLGYGEYPNEEFSKDAMVSSLVGELQRMRAYGARGLLAPEKIPNHIWYAYLRLIQLGYTKQLTSESQ